MSEGCAAATWPIAKLCECCVAMQLKLKRLEHEHDEGDIENYNDEAVDERQPAYFVCDANDGDGPFVSRCLYVSGDEDKIWRAAIGCQQQWVKFGARVQQHAQGQPGALQEAKNSDLPALADDSIPKNRMLEQ